MSFCYTDFPRMPFKKDFDDNIALTNITITKGNGEFEKYEVSDECNAFIKKETSSLLLGCASTVIPDGVKEIWDHAFAGCLELKSIYIPATVTSICRCAFLRCTNLASVHIPEGVISIGERAFAVCSSLKEIVIPDGVIKLEHGAFKGCKALTTVTLPKAVKKMPDAFFDCTGITTINVPAKKADYYKQRLPEELHQFIVEMEPVKKAKKKK